MEELVLEWGWQRDKRQETRWSTMFHQVLEIHLFWGQKDKGQGHEAQQRCRRGSWHSCECWLLLSVTAVDTSLWCPENVPTSSISWSSACEAASWSSRLDDARLPATAPTVRLTTLDMLGPTHGRMSHRTPSAISVTLLFTSFRHGTNWSKICGHDTTHWLSTATYASKYDDTIRYGRLTCAQRLTRWPA